VAGLLLVVVAALAVVVGVLAVVVGALVVVGVGVFVVVDAGFLAAPWAREPLLQLYMVGS